MRFLPNMILQTQDKGQETPVAEPGLYFRAEKSSSGRYGTATQTVIRNLSDFKEEYLTEYQREFNNCL
ncbi:hypothetical protein DYBT9275_05865 [Dyadobacter sp. CECT 9275]|uniref:Uncharacterized protein n=1 Tax=Dyadobacter helix TaxID=2822344 RepID=A0A916JH17_9BACT|nr:hypothetical protein DYBT9275_05865 [Dyadobacter sp. CECT 9275]